MTDASSSARRSRKQVLLRLDPAVHDALARWAADELRSTNAQIDYLLRQALKDAGRLPGNARPHPLRGRPPRQPPAPAPAAAAEDGAHDGAGGSAGGTGDGAGDSG